MNKHWTFLEHLAHWAVWLRFGRSSVEADRITDYIELDDSPDWRGFFRAWRAFSRI